MSLKKSIEEKEFDVRLRDKSLEQGKINLESVKNYLTNLPDDTKNAIIDEDEKVSE